MGKWKSEAGQGLLEVIVAMAIFALVAASLVALGVGSFTGLQQGGEQTEAQALAQEGIEAVRSIRDRAWNEHIYTQSAVAISGSEWVLSGEGTSETIGQYTRTIAFADVCRDANDDIAFCPAIYTDVHTKQVSVDVAWIPRTGITNAVQKVAYITNWDSREWTQTDWSGGPGQSIWSGASEYNVGSGIDDSTSGQLELARTAGGEQLLNTDFEFGTSAAHNWPFTTAGNYTYDSAKIRVAAGMAQLKQSGGSTSLGDTANDQFTSNATGWAFNTWGSGGGEVTPAGTWQNSNGNLAGYVDINIPSDAKNDKTGGYWEQSISIGENDAAVTCSFDWSIIQWTAANGVDDYQFYVFLDSSSGEPAIGSEIWSSGTQSGTTSWSGQQNIDCSSAATAAGTYYYKIAVWLDAPNKTTGPIAGGYDNAKVHWEKDTGGTYPIDRPTISPTSSFSALGVQSWDGFGETATKNGGEIYYQLSNDNGATWQYWNGSSWLNAGSSDYNTANVVNTNIGSFPTTNEQILFQAFLESDGSQLVQLDNIRVDLTPSGAVWSFSAWDAQGGEVTPVGSRHTGGGNPSGYNDITIPAGRGDEVGGYWEQAFTTIADNPALANLTFDYRVFDFNGSPNIAQIRMFVDSSSGPPTTQVGNSIDFSSEGLWTSAGTIDAASALGAAGTYYIKAAIWIETPNTNTGPFTVGFDNISLSLGNTSYATSGTLTSSAFNMGAASPVQTIEWDEIISAGTDIAIDVATAPDSSGSPGTWTAWQNASLAAGTLLPISINGNQWVRYRVTLDGNGTATPVLKEVRINYK